MTGRATSNRVRRLLGVRLGLRPWALPAICILNLLFAAYSRNLDATLGWFVAACGTALASHYRDGGGR